MAVILLVEDEEQVRVLAESFLQTAGHATLSAGSVEQALALLSTQEPVEGSAHPGCHLLDLDLRHLEAWPLSFVPSAAMIHC